MARTTISLRDELYKKLNYLAEQENRSTPNLIETILLRYLEGDFFVDEFEMEELRKDKKLSAEIRRALGDYKAGRGQFV